MCLQVVLNGVIGNMVNGSTLEHIMLDNIKISKRRLKNISYRKNKKKYRLSAIHEDMHLAKSRALIAAISR